MYYYLLPKIGSGTNTDHYCPDIPLNTSYVCGTYYDQFLVGTDVQLTGQTELTPDEAINRAYSVGLDISKWFVS